MNARKGGAFAWLVAAALSIAPACQLLNNRVTVGETRVGQGKLYQSDNPTYDEYFDGVHAVQSQTIDAVEQEQKAREPLEHALGTRNSPPERLVELTHQRMKGGREGPPVHFVVAGLEAPKESETPKKVVATVTVADEAAVPSGERDLVKGLEETAKMEAEIADKFGPISVRAKHLLARHGQLVASLGRDFTTTSRREEVSHELGASKLILTAVADRADKVAASARAFLKGMAEAFPATSEATPPPKEEPAHNGNGRGKSKKNIAPSPKPKPPAAPAKPKPEPVSKAEPAPKAEPETMPEPPPPPKPPPKPKPPAEDFNP
jgi:hypothetical protein